MNGFISIIYYYHNEEEFQTFSLHYKFSLS